jgi:hypothetical protein
MQDHTPKQPPWANVELGARLPQLCAQGEGQTLEFKSELPTQAHDIAKTIASFASSNAGTILYGVNDDGSIVGLEGAENSSARDAIDRRIQGAAKEVRPPVHLSVAWAIHAERVVCAVSVEKGFDAFYYSNHRPIIRRGAASRPAEPGEVEAEFRRRYANLAGIAPLPSTKEISRRLCRVLNLMNEERIGPLTVVDLARSMELASPADLDAVFEERQAPTFAMLDQFCARFAVDKEWLTTGRSQPFSSPVEHRIQVSEYRELLDREAPECVYLARSSSDAGESFFVVETDAMKFWLLPDVWHVSDRVGGGGAFDLMALYRLFKDWIDERPSYMLLGRVVEPRLAATIINGETYPGVVKRLPLSNWWDDLTDLDHKWTTQERSKKDYGRGFVAGQQLLRKMIADK